MFTELIVKDFAIIDNIHIYFGPELNIISGETGAGKSILLKSLGLLMGQKAERESLRVGCEQAIIEGAFDLSRRPDIIQQMANLSIDTEEQLLIIRRVISHKGKSKIYVNGALSTLSTLKTIIFPPHRSHSQPPY